MPPTILTISQNPKLVAEDKIIPNHSLFKQVQSSAQKKVEKKNQKTIKTLSHLPKTSGAYLQITLKNNGPTKLYRYLTVEQNSSFFFSFLSVIRKKKRN